MIKTQIVFIIFIVSGFLLTIQLIALQCLIQKATIEEPRTWRLLDHVSSLAAETSLPLFVIDRLVLDAIHDGVHFGAPRRTVFPLPDESRRLKKLKRKLNKHELKPLEESYNQTDTTGSCRLFCGSNSPITHLATLSEFVSDSLIAKFGAVLKNKASLTLLNVTQNDPSFENLNIQNSIVTHLIILDEDIDIRRRSHVIFITVLHERVSGSYWWAAPLILTDYQKRLLHRQGIKQAALSFAPSDTIFDKTGILRTSIDGLTIGLPNPSTTFQLPSEGNRFIECDLKRAQQFHAKHGKESSAEAAQFRNRAQVLLQKVKVLLDDLGIPFWLSSGTLLGQYRQCDFITYSGDVDIGIFIDDFRPELVESFSVNNLPLIHRFGRMNDSLELSFFHDNLKLDIFFFYRETDYYWNGGTQARTGNKFKYYFSPFTLCWSEFIGLLVRIPCQTEEYLIANYGKDWETPTKSWDWKSSPPNVKPNGQWKPEEWTETIQMIPLAGS